MKKTIMFILMILALATIVHAGDLRIDDIDVFVDGSKEKGISSSGGDVEEVEPGQTIRVKITVENTFSSSSDIDFEEVTVTGTLEEIDDDDDLEDESNDFRLRADDDKTITLEFKVPLQVDDRTFDLKIEVEGEDENGTKYRDDATLDIEIEKESHELLLDRAEFDLSHIQCGRTANLRVLLYNIGTNDEDVTLTITNPDLNINRKEEFELMEEYDDDDNKYDRTLSLTVPSDAKEGIYPIRVEAEYNDGTIRKNKDVNLEIKGCVSTSASTTIRTEPDVVTTITPSVQTVTATATPAIKYSRSFWDENKFALLVGLAYLIVIMIAVVLVVSFLNKRK